MDVQLKRAYDPPHADDGIRVLVDRLWPRGLSKAAAQFDEWVKDAAPSAALRKAWHQDPEGHSDSHFTTFSEAYRAELTEPPASEALAHLVELARSVDRLTLVYGAKDREINHAVVLREALLEALDA